uniref:G protein-coupled receptor n=1 Tax=Ditylenchus dipsaci TaxID=166011 RepID=A0A915DCD8_9BILA
MNVEEPTTVRIIYYFELFLNQVSPVLNVFFIFLLIRHNVMHNNLRVLMSVFCVASMLMALTRLPQLFLQLTGINVFDESLYRYTRYLHDLLLSFFFYVKISFTLERLIATVRVKTYETETKPYFAIISALIMLFIGGLFCTFITYQLSHSSKIGGITVYPDPNFVGFMTNNTATSMITMYAFSSKAVKPMAGALFNLAVAIASTLIPICAIGFHPILRRTTLKYALKLRPSKYNKRIQPHELEYNIGPKSLITGQQLIVHLDCQRDIYFENLRDSWT